MVWDPENLVLLKKWPYQQVYFNLFIVFFLRLSPLVKQIQV